MTMQHLLIHYNNNQPTTTCSIYQPNSTTTTPPQPYDRLSLQHLSTKNNKQTAGIFVYSVHVLIMFSIIKIYIFSSIIKILHYTYVIFFSLKILNKYYKFHINIVQKIVLVKKHLYKKLKIFVVFSFVL